VKGLKVIEAFLLRARLQRTRRPLLRVQQRESDGFDWAHAKRDCPHRLATL